MNGHGMMEIGNGGNRKNENGNDYIRMGGGIGDSKSNSGKALGLHYTRT